MSGFRFTPLAKRHLVNIWTFSANRWGERRADKYLKNISKAVAEVAAGRRRGQVCEQYGARLQRVLSGSHAIYLRYESELDLYSVVGVLHQQMDPPRHLTESDEE